MRIQRIFLPQYLFSVNRIPPLFVISCLQNSSTSTPPTSTSRRARRVFFISCITHNQMLQFCGPGLKLEETKSAPSQREIRLDRTGSLNRRPLPVCYCSNKLYYNIYICTGSPRRAAGIQQLAVCTVHARGSD